MNKKRFIITIIAVVVLLALVTTGVLLLTRGDNLEATGAIYGTVGVNTVEKPENMDGLTFGLSLGRIYQDGGFGGTTISVKDGETVSLIKEGDVVLSVVLDITRFPADSSYQLVPGSGVTVYSQEIPTSLVWNYGDVLSVVDWTDDAYDGCSNIQSSYECVWSDSCVGQFYSTQINVSYTNSVGSTCYCVYLAGITVNLQDLSD